MYAIRILRTAQRQLARVPQPHRDRIAGAIGALAKAPRPPGCAKLTGRDAWRIRIGTYRVLYEIEDDVLTRLVVNVGHRRDIYR